MSSIARITPADAKARFGAATMTPDTIVWFGNVQHACIGSFAWPL